MKFPFYGLLSAALLLTQSPAVAAAPPEKATAAESPALPESAVDPAFDGKVDLNRVRHAIQTNDCRALLVETKRLAVAERQVGRPHRAIPSSVLFDALMRMITENGDGDTLDLVEKDLQDLGQEAARPIVEQARLLLAAPRRVDLGPGVQQHEVSAAAVTLYGTLKEQVRVARVVGDVEVLNHLREAVAANSTLHPKQRKYLLTMTDTSIASLEAKSDGTLLALSTLVQLPVR